MTKSELVEKLLGAFPDLEAKEVRDGVETALGSMVRSLSDDGKVEIRGFGSLESRVYRPREVVNPANGETVRLEERRVPGYRASKLLLERLNPAESTDPTATSV